MKLDDYIERLKELEEREPLWQRVKDILSNLVFSPDSAIQGAVETEDWNALLHEALVRRAPGWYYEQIATAAPAGSTTAMWTFDRETQAREMKAVAEKYGTATLTMNPPYTVLLRTLSPLPEDVVEELNKWADRVRAGPIKSVSPHTNKRETKHRIYAGTDFIKIGDIFAEAPEDYDTIVTDLIEDYTKIRPSELDYDENNYRNGFQLTTVQVPEVSTIFYILPEGDHDALYIESQPIHTSTVHPTHKGRKSEQITIGRLTHTVLNDMNSFPKGTNVVFLRQPIGGMYTAVPYSYYATGTQFEEDAKKAGVLIQAPAEDFEVIGSYTPDEAAKYFY